MLYSEIAKGRLLKLKVGRRSLITAAALEEWLALLESEQRAGGAKEPAPTSTFCPLAGAAVCVQARRRLIPAVVFEHGWQSSRSSSRRLAA